MSGWIRLYRGWRDCEAFADEPLTEREAWVWLIEKAAWKPCMRRNTKGERIQIERGQFHTSLRNLGEAWGWGKNKVARFLERLEDHEMIGTASGQSGCTITICNYDKYQDVEDSQQQDGGTASGQSRDTQEEGKEITSEPKGSSEKETVRAKSDFPCPPDVDPSHWRDFMANRRRKKCVNSPTAYAGVLRCLAEYADDEWPPGRLVHRSAEQGWAKIVNPHEDKFNGSQKHSGNHQPAKRASSFDAILAARRNLGAG